ncbi:MAG: hypothetical protein AUH07_06730 [Gemmatimonadetes bacterium 13_2_20CM_70_9]|nr:MAG: hypothetical protein AUH07_06730 [Gemmatimonadetes bacterium 13_2_20CM_70_9]
MWCRCALVGLAACVPVRLSAQAPPATVDTIVVVNHNVFDADGDAPRFLTRLVNAVHVTTRPWVIRHALLVNPGDRYDSARAVESERALRALYVFSRVRVDTTRLAGRLAVRAVTTDGWSTKPQFGFSSAAGDVSWMVGIVEDNFLGTATSLTAVHNHTPDRNIFDLHYQSPHFFGRRTRLALAYSNKSDGSSGSWAIGVPFYETAARRALETGGSAGSERVLIFRDAALDTTLAHRTLRFDGTGGYALHATSRDYVRLWVSGVWRREVYEPVTTAVFPDSVFGTVGTGLDVGHVRLQVLERLNSFARREDVDISQSAHIGVWAAPRAWGYPSGQAGVGVEVSGQLAAPWHGGFAVLSGAGDGVFTADQPDSGRVSAALSVVSQNLRGQTLILHLEGARLRKPPPGIQFDLAVRQNGPRVFGIHAFTGTRMVWLALEDRVVVADEIWGLFGLGVAPFFDYGGAWYADELPRLDGDIGVSLRIGPTRSARAAVGEIAVGYRFGQGLSGRRWGVTIRKVS